MSVLFFHMPFASPTVPNLAVEILAETLRQDDIEAGTFYGTLRFPRTPHLEALIHSTAGEVVFTPLVFPDYSADEVVERFLSCERAVSELAGNYVRLFPCVGDSFTPNARIAGEIRTHMALAEDWINACLREIPSGRYQTYAFSVAFDAQKLASLALAFRLKAREPSCTILFGGTAVDGDMGNELLRAFDYVDVVCQGDADWRISMIAHALEGRGDLNSIPGLLIRREDRVASTQEAFPGQNLDDLPLPDYGSFLEQLARSDWCNEAPIFLFEGSRGCWWGEKHHCRFCGLRADSMHFRRKSAERVCREVDWLAEHHPDHRILYATDAILDARAPKGMLQMLAKLRERRPWKLFFEIKSNIGRKEAELLSSAGVTTVQPGIESFSNRVLKLMDKGSNALINVEFLKSMSTFGINPLYNLLIGTPGERAEDYVETLELIPLLHHLPAPAQVSFLQLDRFSPYFQNPESFGITAVEPEPVYRVIYPRSSINLSRLVYRFQHDSAEQHDPLLRETWSRLEAAVSQWRVDNDTRVLSWQDLGDRIVIIEGREARSTHWLFGAAAELYRLCDRGANPERLIARLPGIAPGALRACLARWRKRGWIFRFSSDQYLALAQELVVNPVT